MEDPTLPARTEETIIQEHIGKKYQVYKHWYDANGKEVKIEKFGEPEVYANMPKKVRISRTAAVPAEAAPEPFPTPDAGETPPVADPASAAAEETLAP